MTTPENSSTSELARVAVKPPPFWHKDPTSWFLQLEAQFNLGGITNDDTKFYTTVSAIDLNMVQSVRDLILEPPSEKKYETLKQKLISLFADSEAARLQQLLQDTQLGDMRPSQLLSKMKDLAANDFTEPVLKSLWLNRLPGQTQAILAVSSEPLIKLAEMADKIHELNPPTTFHVQEIREERSLQQQIDVLSQQIAKLSMRPTPRQNRRSYSRKNNRSRSNSRNRQRRNESICFYHKKFGNDARKCAPPCNYQQQQGN